MWWPANDLSRSSRIL